MLIICHQGKKLALPQFKIFFWRFLKINKKAIVTGIIGQKCLFCEFCYFKFLFALIVTCYDSINKYYVIVLSRKKLYICINHNINNNCLENKSCYWPSLQNGSDQLIVTLCIYISIYPSVHKQLIGTFFEGRPVANIDDRNAKIWL